MMKAYIVREKDEFAAAVVFAETPGKAKTLALRTDACEGSDFLNMDELKPCPFCGGKAYLFANDGVRVICAKCRAASRRLVDAMGTDAPFGNAVKSVIESWNRRATDGKETEVN